MRTAARLTAKEGHIYSISLAGRVFYVGQTCRSPEQRWRQHMRQGKGSVGKMLQMFGRFEDFDWAVIETVPEAQLDEREAFWIEKLGTFYPNGANMFSGRAAGRPSEAVREKMREAAKRRWQDPEQRAILVAAAKSKNENKSRRAEILEAARAARTPEGAKRKREKALLRCSDPAERQRLREQALKGWAMRKNQGTTDAHHG